MRVHELAKEYKIKSTDFVDIIQDFGIGIKSHLSSLDDAQVADIKFKMDMKDHTKKAELVGLGIEVESKSLNLTQAEVDEVIVSTEKDDLRRNIRDREASILAEKARQNKKEQYIKLEKSGFWGWLKDLFG